MPLKYTIYFILKRIYENHEILTSVTRNEMREILLLCMKNLYFTFRDVVYLQTNGVALGSPLEAVFFWNIYGSFRKVFTPLLTAELYFLKRYVDDTKKLKQ